MQSENVTLDLGIIKVKAVPVNAYAGYGKRVHADADGALIDLATCLLAEKWLNVSSTGFPTFAQLLGYIERDPDLFEAAVKLAKFKR